MVEDIHLRSVQGLAFVNLLKVRSNESEEESFLEETESSEEDNSEDVIYLGSNYENDEKENQVINKQNLTENLFFIFLLTVGGTVGPRVPGTNPFQ